MERITSSDAVGVRPANDEAGTPGYFTNGDPGVPTPATTVTAEWLNRVQEELVAVIEDAGLTLDPDDDTQLLQAIDQKISDGLTNGQSIRQRVAATDATEIDVSTPAIPLDNSKPQIGEGTQVLSAAITPELASGKIAIDVAVTVYASTAKNVTLAVFVNGGSDAIAVATLNVSGVATIVLKAEYAHGSTSAHTFTVRAGPQTTGGTFKANEATYSFGGLSKSIIELRETE